MFLKVLSLFWLLNGAPVAQDFFQGENHFQVSKKVQFAIQTATAKQGLIGHIEAKIIARDVVRICECLDIDPFVFTALIWRESHFKHSSKSETGAVGVTQLTQTGVHEVLDRLSAESIRKHPVLRKKLASCAPDFLRSIPRHPERFNLPEWKSKVARSRHTALLFGAVLFKVNLKGSYRTALEKYNGDPKVKTQYAKDVLSLAKWIESSFSALPSVASNSSKFLASIQTL